MKRIGFTQRVELKGTERRDCLDQRWVQLAEKAGVLAIPISNSDAAPEKTLQELKIEGLVLTGGNDLSALAEAATPAPERDRLEERLLKYASANGLPVLGICRGMQMLVHSTGGHVSPVEGHGSERHAVELSGHISLLPIRKDVNSAHFFGIASRSDLPLEWEVLATASDGSIEAIRHTEHPWWGLMWHPEREADFEPGLLLFKKVFG